MKLNPEKVKHKQYSAIMMPVRAWSSDGQVKATARKFINCKTGRERVLNFVKPDGNFLEAGSYYLEHLHDERVLVVVARNVQ